VFRDAFQYASPTEVPNQQPVLPPLAQVMIDENCLCLCYPLKEVASPRCPTQRRGNIGVSPIGAAAMTGFSMAKTWGGQFLLSSQVTGGPWGVCGGAVANDLSVAVLAMQNAYTDAASRVNG
jgi:hypothetical protein